MTVRSLIALLTNCNLDADVYYEDSMFGKQSISEANTVSKQLPNDRYPYEKYIILK